MLLSYEALEAHLKSQKIVVDPLGPNALQPASIDLRLGNHFLSLDDSFTECLSLDKGAKYKEHRQSEIILPPKSFLLATTFERIKLPADITAFVEGRSSIGRMGLFIQNAGLIDAGFEGHITLELFNANSVPIKLQAKRRVCQLVFFDMDQKTQFPYRGKYQNQVLATGSKIFEDAEIDPQGEIS
ncbi:MAG: dCTP deaminase [Bdellovibrionaceae bacterium]|nr:dCTP deaminase [Pseudobdellovibrionaceae bacterium]